MDGAAPPHGHAWIEGDPVTLPDGRETIARCAQCGSPFVPSTRAHRHCSVICRARWKQRTEAGIARSRKGSATYARIHQSYRMARRALRAAGIDPSTVPALETLRGRGLVEDWRAVVGLPPAARGRIHPSTPAPSRAPWGASVGPQPEHVAWGLELGGVPLRTHARHVHGTVSHLIAAPHGQVARWALAMPSGARSSGWGVVLFRHEDAVRLAGTTHGALIGSTRTTLQLGAIVRLRAPALLEPGRYRVTIDAVTPVSHMIAGRTRPVTQPSTDTMLRCAGDLLQRLGLSTGRLHIASVACETLPERVVIGGHVGPITGWVGRVIVECNAPAAWALSLARHAGLGGRVAYGLGRVRVEVTPWR